MKLSLFIPIKLLLLLFLPMSILANSIVPGISDNKNGASSFASSLTPKELKWLDKKQSLNYVYDPDWTPFEWKNNIGLMWLH